MADETKQNAQNAGENSEEDAVFSMVDYLKEEQELEADANAVLGGSDEDQCTYPKGHVPRQALYACYTCDMKDKAPAGVCLACSYACHEGHELYELYTKRNFRCDCGNGKFVETKCKLCPEKSDVNIENKYNQNFKGLYCVCARPYPDPEDEIEDEMIQCIICEDWLHGRHLGEGKPPSDFAEMICVGCMSKHDFLWAYAANSLETSVVKSDSSEVAVDVETTDSKTSTGEKTDKSEPATPRQSDTEQTKNAVEDSKPSASDSDSDKKCLLKELQTREVTHRNAATFWPSGFRSKLCTCDKCLSMYESQGVSFLPSESDTVSSYERSGVARSASSSSQQDQERQLLGSMNHVQQIEMVQGFNDMKSALSDYLKHFAENGTVVRAEDIKEFFQQMEQRKRQKTDHTPAYTCK